MGNAFTPGLLVSEKSAVSKIRKIPLGGEVIVAKGDLVDANQTVGRANLQGRVSVVKAAEALEVDPDKIKKFLRCAVGDIVEENQLLGETSHFFGLLKSKCFSPVRGYIEEISEITGHISIREPEEVTEVKAYLTGAVTDVTDKDVEISCTACVIQGIFGLGGEDSAEIVVVTEDEDINPLHLQNGDFKDKLIVGGRSIDTDAINLARISGAKGVVVGSIKHGTMHDILGEYIGVAITGQENLGLTIIVTEGFGTLKMDERTLALFKKHQGDKASFNGSTQIRAGVVRPEVIIPLWENLENGTKRQTLTVAKELKIGTRIRIIRAPYFGETAIVSELPEQPSLIDTEAKVRVLKAKLQDGTEAVVPRANVEIID